MKEHLRELVAQSLLDLRRQGRLPPELPTPDYVIERTKSREHGDYATNVALQLAKKAGLNPRELAGWLISPLVGVGTINGGLSVGSFLVSLLGAVVLLAIVNLFTRGRARS